MGKDIDWWWRHDFFRGAWQQCGTKLQGAPSQLALQMAGGHALEFLKIDKQVSNDSYAKIIRKMTANKGLAGTLDGFFPWGCLQSAVKVCGTAVEKLDRR